MRRWLNITFVSRYYSSARRCPRWRSAQRERSPASSLTSRTPSSPASSVTLKSTAVPGAPSTVTGATGAYRFSNLPAGLLYGDVRIAGFTTVTRAQVPVGVGQEADIDAQ